MLKTYVIIFLVSTLLISCAKNEIIIPENPEPCFYADRINVNRYDTITFFNCSKNAVDVYFTIVKRNETVSFFDQIFGESNKIDQVFKDTGLFDAVINPRNYTVGTLANIEQRIPISVK